MGKKSKRKKYWPNFGLVGKEIPVIVDWFSPEESGHYSVVVDLDPKYIHEPHLCDEEILQKAGITLGKTYPLPIVDHKEAKDKALKIYYDWNK